jgi:hypothetical protein
MVVSWLSFFVALPFFCAKFPRDFFSFLNVIIIYVPVEIFRGMIIIGPPGEKQKAIWIIFSA